MPLYRSLFKIEISIYLCAIIGIYRQQNMKRLIVQSLDRSAFKVQKSVMIMHG